MFKMEKRRLIENINEELSRLYGTNLHFDIVIFDNDKSYFSYICIEKCWNFALDLSFKITKETDKFNEESIFIVFPEQDSFEDLFIKIKSLLLVECLKYLESSKKRES